jgi:uncharacterized protein
MTRSLLHKLWEAAHAALVWVVLAPVALYRAVISPMKRVPSCRFMPTCSEYAVEAVKTRGIVVGGALSAWRLARCHPLCKGGFDPVPPRRHCREEHA